MGTLDELVEVFLDFIEFFDLDLIETVEAIEETDEPTEILATIVEVTQPADEVAAIVVDSFEEFVVNPVQQEGQLTPENVELLLDEVEGNAAAILFGAIAAAVLTEVGTFGQVDEVPAEIFQAVAALGVEDVTGREIDARLQEGVDPALKQKVHREHRSKQADFIDFVEANRAAKEFDRSFETRSGEVPPDLRSLLHPDDFGYLADPDTYGTIPDQTPLYEVAGLQVGEPEEIIEEPVQYGLPVPLRPVEAVNAISGQPEDSKAIYEQVIEQLPLSENLIQDYARLAEFNFRLREKVQAGAITPEQARSLIEPELRDIIENPLDESRYREEDRTADEVVDILAGELERNFTLLADLPKDPPTFSDIERAFRVGVISAEEYQRFNEEFGVPSRFFGMKLAVQCIRAGTDDIVRQEALGRLTSQQAAFRLGFIGWTDGQIARLLAGGDPDELIRDEQVEGRTESGLSVTLAPGIGETRGAVLSQVGIGSLGDLADADVESVTEVTNLSNDGARRSINAAGRILQGGG
jgi:hypothetical protein